MNMQTWPLLTEQAKYWAERMQISYSQAHCDQPEKKPTAAVMVRSFDVYCQSRTQDRHIF